MAQLGQLHTQHQCTTAIHLLIIKSMRLTSMRLTSMRLFSDPDNPQLMQLPSQKPPPSSLQTVFICSISSSFFLACCLRLARSPTACSNCTWLPARCAPPTVLFSAYPHLVDTTLTCTRNYGACLCKLCKRNLRCVRLPNGASTPCAAQKLKE